MLPQWLAGSNINFHPISWLLRAFCGSGFISLQPSLNFTLALPPPLPPPPLPSENRKPPPPLLLLLLLFTDNFVHSFEFKQVQQMAAKRLRDVSGQDPDHPDGSKRIRRLPSFPTVIREAMMMKSMQNFVFMLEPLLRKVVHEEMEQGLMNRLNPFERLNQLQIEAPEPASLKLIFKKPISLPIFTGTKIEDIEKNPMQILLVRADNENEPLSLPYPLKLEVVVLDGEFPLEDSEDWTSDELKKFIVKERTGRRPLITGEINVTLRDGRVTTHELSLTDNSSWLRSRQFRIAVRIVPGTYNGERILEAITEPFTVKDHRGELYKKNYPPALNDEVWRLEKIGKDGAFHKKLSAESINTVQDFLKLWAVDAEKLRKIVEPSMTDRMWEVIIAHAKTCEIGKKLYLHHTPGCDIILDSICQVTQILIKGMAYAFQDLKQQEKAYVQQLVRQAHQNWDALQEADGLYTQFIPLTESFPQIGEEEELEELVGGYDGFISPHQPFYGQ